MKNKKLTYVEKMLKLHDDIVDCTESLEPYALMLSYLYPAIVRNGFIDIHLDGGRERDFYDFIHNRYSKNHYVCNHIKVLGN